ncbi:MAG TPA: MscL family protein, partial [Caulobacter sp.]
INTLIQFVIVAAVVFLLVKVVNGIRRADAAEPGPETPAAPTGEEALLMEIRDLLAKGAAPKVAVSAPKAAVAKAPAKAAVKPKPKAK